MASQIEMNWVSFFVEPLKFLSLVLFTRQFPRPRTTTEWICKVLPFALGGVVYWLAFGPMIFWGHVVLNSYGKWFFGRYYRDNVHRIPATLLDQPHSDEGPSAATKRDKTYSYQVDGKVITKDASLDWDGIMSKNDDKSPPQVMVRVLPNQPKSGLLENFLEKEIELRKITFSSCCYRGLQSIVHTLVSSLVVILFGLDKKFVAIWTPTYSIDENALLLWMVVFGNLTFIGLGAAIYFFGLFGMRLTWKCISAVDSRESNK